MPGKEIIEAFTKDQARGYLEKWVKSHGTILIDEYSMVQWIYPGRSPFWTAVWTGMRSWNYGRYGFHIHEDGEVIYIGRMDNADAE